MQFKTLLNVERYLTSIAISFHLRKAFAKFRYSDHQLNIEVCRHHNAPIFDNKIKSNVIGVELHVFLFCKRYEEFRKSYIGDIQI